MKENAVAERNMITNPDDLSLTEWVRRIKERYKQEREKDRNIYNDYILESIWLHVVEEASELAEALRMLDTERIIENIGSIFSWFCSFIGEISENEKIKFKEHLKNRLQSYVMKGLSILGSIRDKEELRNIQQKITKIIDNDFNKYYADIMVLLKYPRCCPFCQSERYCKCLGMSRSEYIVAKESFERLRESGSKLAEQGIISELKIKKLMANEMLELTDIINFPLALCEWRHMFERIYGRLIRVQTLEQIGFHLHEEIGEVARALRHLRNALACGEEEGEVSRYLNELQDELADVFDWLNAILIKLSYIHVEKEYTLGEVVARIISRK